MDLDKLQAMAEQIRTLRADKEKAEAEIRELNDAWDSLMKLQPIAGMSRPEVMRRIIDQAMKAEKYCAGLRKVVEEFYSVWVSEGRPSLAAVAKSRMQNAQKVLESSTCGQGYVSKEELKPTIGLLWWMEQIGGLGLEVHAKARAELARLQKLMEDKP